VATADDDDVETLRVLHVPYSMPPTGAGCVHAPAKGAG